MPPPKDELLIAGVIIPEGFYQRNMLKMEVKADKGQKSWRCLSCFKREGSLPASL